MVSFTNTSEKKKIAALLYLCPRFTPSVAHVVQAAAVASLALSTLIPTILRDTQSLLFRRDLGHWRPHGGLETGYHLYIIQLPYTAGSKIKVPRVDLKLVRLRRQRTFTASLRLV